jgi:hypothetical protein
MSCRRKQAIWKKSEARLDLASDVGSSNRESPSVENKEEEDEWATVNQGSPFLGFEDDARRGSPEIRENLVAIPAV